MRYAFIASTSCIVILLYLSRNQRLVNSGSAAAKAEQWLMNFYLSFALLLGFIAAYFIAFTPYQHLLPYVDPVMVALVSGFALKVPLSQMGKQLREVLDMGADDYYTLRIQAVVDQIKKEIRLR